MDAISELGETLERMEAVTESASGVSDESMDEDDFESEPIPIDETDFEVEDPDLDDELADIAESDETLAMGLDGRLKSSFETAHSTETGTEKTRVDDPADPLHGYELPVDHDLANKLLKRVYRELNEAPESVPEQLILGVPQYALLEPWAREAHDNSIVEVLPVADVRVVPGPMVHAGRGKNELLTDYIERNTDDG